MELNYAKLRNSESEVMMCMRLCTDMFCNLNVSIAILKRHNLFMRHIHTILK